MDLMNKKQFLVIFQENFLGDADDDTSEADTSIEETNKSVNGTEDESADSVARYQSALPLLNLAGFFAIWSLAGWFAADDDVSRKHPPKS